MKNIEITSTDLRYIREPLKAPFGFKGRYIGELWQTVSLVKSANFAAACPCTISVLWSDANVFGDHAPAASSELMREVTSRALDMIRGETFTRPDKLINAIFPDLKTYADKICGRVVAETFVLNSLVGVDYALWSLYARENGFSRFDGIIPPFAKKALSHRHGALAHIPLISYAVTAEQLKTLLESGTGLLKIKIGHSSGKSATQEEDMRDMLEWDRARLSAIHELAKNYNTGLTKDGRVHYYLDANGRYDGKDRLCALLDHASRIGALDYIELIEEPFPPEDESFVGDLPVTVNADESAHSLADVKRRLQQGYRAVALKPIAKTMSVSFDMAAEVYKNGGECLCADLTVVPLLAEWNKQFAARIGGLKGMSCGCIEINGDQNYQNWAQMCKMLPRGAEYMPEKNGRFTLSPDFYSSECLLFGENGYNALFNDERK
ncbi:MAG: L-alanine-DL-glutamate epimerase [Clostridia bacterium]|nr:L-alanine-DL-glutamate epimerase [Clostridia bacterium]